MTLDRQALAFDQLGEMALAGLTVALDADAALSASVDLWRVDAKQAHALLTYADRVAVNDCDRAGDGCGE